LLSDAAEIIRDHAPTWPQAFEAARRPVEARLGSMIEGIDHIGNTSVPGLAAKPLSTSWSVSRASIFD
jgi:GrpB-like predicted nucleotidyltransferase (UPF0157 family)